MNDEGAFRAAEPLRAWRAGRVARWHAHADLSDSGDHVDAHSGRMGVLALLLFPHAERALLEAVLIHDLGEMGVGDVSGPAKGRDPVLAERIDLAERHSLRETGLARPELAPPETLMLVLLDRLDAFLWMRFKAPWLEALPEWQAARGWLAREGEALGIGQTCAGLL